MSKIIKINDMPSPTFNWLKANDREVELNPLKARPHINESVPDNIAVSAISPEGLYHIGSGIGKNSDEILNISETPFTGYSVPSDFKDDAPLVIDAVLKTKSSEGIFLNVLPGASLTCIVYFTDDSADEPSFSDGSAKDPSFSGGSADEPSFSDDSAGDLSLPADSEKGHKTAGAHPADALFSIKYTIGEGASLTLVTIQKTSENMHFICDLGGDTHDKAKMRQIQVILSGRASYTGSRIDLKGKGSSYESDLAYIVKQDELADINYIINHIGVGTESLIKVSGVLKDNAVKVFRGTIDLRRGAKGAKGTETEDVMLIDEDVINKTIPVILCDEEDVEGNHGATIGRLDEDLLFYMESRGMTEDQIVSMMKEARISSVLSKIPDRTSRDKAFKLAGIETADDVDDR
ncbi:MAG: SufD family Fe-S cluster assembly protein [Lachnospiraceae bacterium]|nr:SufD family Fe-S cluster assembly protein [Lachnospiraceae bacterium]